jgi:hypothetical protein
MIKTAITVAAMAMGLTVHTVYAAENHQHGAQQATPAATAEVKALGGSGKACKDGSQNQDNAGMKSCCCAGMMSKNMGMNHDSDGMDQAAMMERMRMMEERMEMMQKMMMEQKPRS